MQETATETLFANDPLDAKRWTAMVENSALTDVYYLPEYARATAEIEQTEPVALIAGPPSSRLMAPLLVRRMSATVHGSRKDWLDAATPYGYGGILSLSTSGRADSAALHLFLEQLHDWCSNRGVVFCVIRLHPMIEQRDWIDVTAGWRDRLQIHSRGTTISIELSQWNEKDQPAMLRRDRRADLRLAGRTLHISWGTGEDGDADRALDIFSTLYHALMDRQGTENFYRFPKSYFTKLRTLGDRLSIALAWSGDEPVGGSLFLIGSRYAHYHLAATNDIGHKLGASTLLIVEAARRARQRRQHGCELLHLGGGLRPGDSLEDFKLSFGGRSHIYRYVTFIADRERFDEIRRLPTTTWPYNLLDSIAPSNASTKS